MKIQLIAIGKTDFDYLKAGIAIYCDRLVHYTKFEYLELPDLKNTKNLTENQIKTEQSKIILKHLTANTQIVLLDERGKMMDSVQFAKYFEQQQLASTPAVSFVIGGAYGFSEELYNKANRKISLSAMTFSHQMVRLFAVEQIYRAHTILRNEPYHHL